MDGRLRVVVALTVLSTCGAALIGCALARPRTPLGSSGRSGEGGKAPDAGARHGGSDGYGYSFNDDPLEAGRNGPNDAATRVRPAASPACACAPGDPLCSCPGDSAAAPPPIGPGALPSDEPPPAPLERFPTIEAPDEVAPSREFAVLVSLTDDQLTPEVKVSSGATTAEGRLVMSLPSREPEWPIDVVLTAPGFVLEEGANTGRITLRALGDSTAARFLLRARPTSAPRVESRLHATLYFRGAFLARFSRPIAVTRATAPQPPAAASARPVAEVPAAARLADDAPRAAAGGLPVYDGPPLPLDARAPDLTVHLTHDPPQITLVSPHLVPSTQVRPLPRMPEVASLLAERYAQLSRATPRGARPLAAATVAAPSSREGVIDLLRGFGRQLWDDLAPPPFREALFHLRDQLGPRFRTIQIITDDPVVPWELMRPRRGAEELDFLGVEFQVARWHDGVQRAQTTRPPQRLGLKALVAVAPRYAGALALPHQQEELAALDKVAVVKARTVPGTFAGLRGLFGGMPEGIVHFSGHGVVVPGSGGVTEYAIRLEDANLDVLRWRGLAHPGGPHPLVFFNACEVGSAQAIAGFVDGWAPAVLDSGASGFIGGLWPISDAGAADFAARFYAGLERALEKDGTAPVAWALSEARRSVYETGDPTSLAYVYYGDPLFRFTTR